MSETEQPGGPSPEPEPTTTPPVVDPPSSPAPDASEEGEQPEDQREARDRERDDRRVASLRARLGAAEREREAQRAELEFYRQRAQQQPPGPETPEQAYARERAQIRAEVEAQIRAERFHEQGAGEYGDWRQRCDDLVKMGADPGFAQLLVEMPDGVRVTAALANDPDAVERIAGLRSERARAVALGKYAATLEAGGDAPNGAPREARVVIPPRAAPVTRAPAPVRPVNGRANPVFNEYTASAQQLVDRYVRQNMERRGG